MLLISENDLIHLTIFYNLYILLYSGDKIEKNEMGWACGAYG